MVQLLPLRMSLLLLAAALCACGGGTSSAKDELPPSIVLISLDTVRADHLGLYGYGRDTSPNLDRLGAESLVFDQARTPASWTLTAHMSMLTGLLPVQHGVVSGETALAAEIPTLAERLSDLGYRTIGLYNPGWIHERHGFHRGFDEFLPHKNGEQADANLRKLLPELSPERPFFLFVHLFDAHSEPQSDKSRLLYDCPDPFATMFLADARERLARLRAIELATGSRRPNAEELEAIVALYDGGIRYVDHLVGEWIEEWRESGLLDRSLLIVTADHGEALWQRESRGGGHGGHGGIYEEGLRVPLLLRPPGGAVPARVGAPVNLVDIVPTVLATVGLPLEPVFAGASLLNAGESPETRVRVAAQMSPDMSVLVSGRHKLMLVGPEGEAQRVRAFDLEEDPGEVRPLFPRAAPELVEPLQREWKLLRGTRPELFRPVARPGRARDASAAELAELKALGYAGS